MAHLKPTSSDSAMAWHTSRPYSTSLQCINCVVHLQREKKQLVWERTWRHNKRVFLSLDEQTATVNDSLDATGRYHQVLLVSRHVSIAWPRNRGRSRIHPTGALKGSVGGGVRWDAIAFGVNRNNVQFSLPDLEWCGKHKGGLVQHNDCSSQLTNPGFWLFHNDWTSDVSCINSVLLQCDDWNNSTCLWIVSTDLRRCV